MKLLFLIHSLAGGGAERVTANLANHWAMRGWDITIVSIAAQDFDYYKLDPSVRRIALDLASNSSNILSAIVDNLRRTRAIRRMLKETRPVMAISMMTQSNVLLAMASAGLSVCTIGSERTYPPQMPLHAFWNMLRRYWYGKLSAVVSLTNETRNWLLAGTSCTNVVTIPNPVPWPFPRQAPLVPIYDNCGSARRTMLAVGRLSEEKGFHILIECFTKLASAHSDWNLVILGQGEQREQLRRLINDAHMSERIRLPGQAGNIGDWYLAADLYVMCSRFEGFPNTLAEAMAHGLPAVSFDCDTGPRDIIRHEVDGLLVKPGDTDALCHALSRLMNDERLRSRFAEQAAHARERFSMPTITHQWECLFDSLQ